MQLQEERTVLSLPLFDIPFVYAGHVSVRVGSNGKEKGLHAEADEVLLVLVLLLSLIF